MGQWTWGEPVSLGDTPAPLPAEFSAFGLTFISDDGRRGVVLRTHSRYGGLSAGDNWGELGIESVPQEYVGSIASLFSGEFHSSIINRVTPDNPGWITFPASDGAVYLSLNPVTPGDDYYRIRRILGEHALRYLDENPTASFRLSDPSQTRIHTIKL